MIPALACVRKEPLLPNGPLRLIGQFLQKPTPTARILLAHAPPLSTDHMDMCRWLVYRALDQEGKAGFARFVTSPAFGYRYSAMLRVHLFWHKKSHYKYAFCAQCYKRGLGRASGARCSCYT
jgi:hypothetical protein